MVAYYQTQETSQLMRNAPALSNTRTKVPQRKDLYPLRKMQADTISLKGMPSGGFRLDPLRRQFLLLTAPLVRNGLERRALRCEVWECLSSEDPNNFK